MRVDLTSAVRFDLPRGAVHTTASGLEGVGEERALLVPVNVLVLALADAPKSTVDIVARTIGESIGRRAAGRFGGPSGVREAGVDSVVTSLAAEVALAGLGVLALERWGRALVLLLTATPRFAPEFFAPLLESALGTATSWRNRASLVCTFLSDEDGARYLVSNANSAGQVRRAIESGVGWAEALRRMQRGGEPR
ncbi:MAG: hypothetical protein ACRELY_31410 [Polyangiaceae bacterium]